MELNLKQKKILKLLSINCRFSNKDIAKAVGISEDSVAYQIRRLLVEEKFARFNVQFFHFILGYNSYHLWARADEKNIGNLLKIDAVHSVNTSQGRFDVQFLVFAKSDREFSEILKNIKGSCNFQELCFSKLIGVEKSFSNIISPIDVDVKIPKNRKKIEYSLDSERYPLPEFSDKMKIDNIDKKIISVLIQNPRASFQVLSESSGINRETVRYRMKKYLNGGLITNFGLLHDFKKYGLFVNYFLIRLNTKRFDKRRFLDYINSKMNIFYCPSLRGSYDYIVYVFSKDPLELGEINDGIRKSLGDSVGKLDLLFMGDVLKYEQFPKRVLG